MTAKSTDLDLSAPDLGKDSLDPMTRRWLYENLARIKEIIAALDAGQGVNGTFVVAGKTYTITNGVITSIV